MNNSDIKVSVTVPVYNTSQYLRKCLDSLANQTLKDIEIIIVDDGSKDDSGKICDEYASRYANFRVIHQKNGGLAVARQTGLDAARGEYVIVCDSDDWVEPDMYGALYSEAVRSGADMVICGYTAEYDDGRSINTQTWFDNLDWKAHLKEIFNTSYHNSWARLVRRKLFTENNIVYEPGINMAEDAFILYKLMKAKPKISQIKGYFYHYRKEYGSQSYTNQIKMQQIYGFVKIYKWLEKNYDESLLGNKLYRQKIGIIYYSLRAKDIDTEFIKEFLSENLPWSLFFKNKLWIKSSIVYISKIIPPKIVSYVLNKLYKYVY